MARPRAAVPKYRHHKATDRAYTTVGRKFYYFGKYGSRESKEAYRRFLMELDAERQGERAAEPVVVPPLPDKMKNPLVSEVAVAFLERNLSNYSKSESNHFRAALAVLVNKCGDTPAAEFGPLLLAGVRDVMIESGWTREYIGTQVRRVRAVFRWAEMMELVLVGKWFQLRSLPGLKKGKTGAPDQRVVEPVDDDRLAKIIPHLTKTLADMVTFQRLTGCRPQEVCRLRASEIDRTGPVWKCIPADHKMVHLDRVRVIYIGPKAQAIIRDRIDAAPDAPAVFSPRQSCDDKSASRRAAAKGRIRKKKSSGPRANIGEWFKASSYRLAVYRACVAAGVEPFWPNQLRHAFACEVRDRFGLEAAQKLLGHKYATTTERYAKPSEASAMEAAEVVG